MQPKERQLPMAIFAMIDRLILFFFISFQIWASSAKYVNLARTNT